MGSNSEENMKLGHGRRHFHYACSYSWGRPGIMKIRSYKKLQNEIYLWLYSKISRYLPIVVLFASRINVQLPQFFAYRPDQTAEVINASCVSFYCFAPSSYTGKVLKINFLTTLLIY